MKRARITQKAIEEIACELFPRKGFGATSLDDIAEALGATKGALFYHVKNKEEILRLIYLTDPFVREIIFRKKAYERYFEQITEEGQASCVFQPAIHPKITINGLLGKCNWLSQEYRSAGQYSTQQIADMFVEMVSGLKR